MTYTLHHGDCLEVLATLPDCSVDAIVTDPPAVIAFMGKDWDKDKGGKAEWIDWMFEVALQCRRVCARGSSLNTGWDVFNMGPSCYGR